MNQPNKQNEEKRKRERVDPDEYLTQKTRRALDISGWGDNGNQNPNVIWEPDARRALRYAEAQERTRITNILKEVPINKEAENYASYNFDSPHIDLSDAFKAGFELALEQILNKIESK